MKQLIIQRMVQLIIQLMVQVGPSSPSRGARRIFFNASARAAGTSQPSLGRLQVRLTAVSVRAEQVQHLLESPGRRAGTEANEIN